jgi:hypothetical protein
MTDATKLLNMEAGDICPDCELIGVPGALCPAHARGEDAASRAAALKAFVLACEGPDGLRLNWLESLCAAVTDYGLAQDPDPGATAECVRHCRDLARDLALAMGRACGPDWERPEALPPAEDAADGLPL